MILPRTPEPQDHQTSCMYSYLQGIPPFQEENASEACSGPDRAVRPCVALKLHLAGILCAIFMALVFLDLGS